MRIIRNLAGSVDVSGVNSPEELLIRAGLDYTIRRHQLAMRDDDGNLVTESLSKYRAIVGNGQVFSIATERYHPHQNIQIAKFFMDFIDAGDAQMETFGSVRNGAIVWALAKITNADMVINEALTEGKILVATSHDGSIKTLVKPTTVNIVCMNTLMAAVREDYYREYQWSLSHRSVFDDEALAEAKSIVLRSSEVIQQSNNYLTKLATMEADASARQQFINKLLGNSETINADSDDGRKSRLYRKLEDSILAAPGANLGNTSQSFYGLVQGVTHFVDHVRGRSADNRLASAWFGPGAKLKTDALRIAGDMTGVRAAH